MIKWIETEYETIDSPDKILHMHIMYFIQDLKRKNPTTTHMIREYLLAIQLFFNNLIKQKYQYAPLRNPIEKNDIPESPKNIPRDIDIKELCKLLDEMDRMENIYQRTALRLQVWTGARREEIRRLSVDALRKKGSKYSIILPAAKSNKEREVPIDKEGAMAFQELLEYREINGFNTKKIPDPKTGEMTDFLFSVRNTLISSSFLFQNSMSDICIKTDIVNVEGKAKYSSHSFRHTIATLMINHPDGNIISVREMLGHMDDTMTKIYTNETAETREKRYQRGAEKIKKLRSGYMDILTQNNIDKGE